MSDRATPKVLSQQSKRVCGSMATLLIKNNFSLDILAINTYIDKQRAYSIHRHGQDGINTTGYNQVDFKFGHGTEVFKSCGTFSFFQK